MTDRNALADEVKEYLQHAKGLTLGRLLERVEVALRQSPSDASPRAPIEPVAWRWRFRGVEANNPWRLVTVDKMSEVACEIEPLYAAPAAAPTLGREALIEHVMLLEGDALDTALRKLGFEPDELLNDFNRAMFSPPRKPTEAMLNAARDWSVERFHRGIGNDAATGCWQAMYDAALTAPDQSGPDEKPSADPYNDGYTHEALHT